MENSGKQFGQKVNEIFLMIGPWTFWIFCQFLTFSLLDTSLLLLVHRFDRRWLLLSFFRRQKSTVELMWIVAEVDVVVEDEVVVVVVDVVLVWYGCKDCKD